MLNEDKTLQELAGQTDLRDHLKRFGADNVLMRIYNALPPHQKADFVSYRKEWAECDRLRTDRAFPLCISLELVAGCNLSCPHCVRNIPAWRRKAPELFSGARMGLDTFQQIVEECVANRLPSLWLGCSGEALLERGLVDMVRYAHRRGIMDLILTTNGTLLTKEIMDGLLEVPITRINISVDAFTPETYQKVRGGDFGRLMSNIEYILENRKALPAVRLTFIDSPVNRHEKDKFIDCWKTRADVVDIQKFIDLRRSARGAATPFHCSAPWRIIDIQANGDLVPCNSFFAIPEMIMGNIHERSIRDIWNSDKFRRFREDMKQGRYTASCQKCFGA